MNDRAYIVCVACMQMYMIWMQWLQMKCVCVCGMRIMTIMWWCDVTCSTSLQNIATYYSNLDSYRNIFKVFKSITKKQSGVKILAISCMQAAKYPSNTWHPETSGPYRGPPPCDHDLILANHQRLVPWQGELSTYHQVVCMTMHLRSKSHLEENPSDS